MNQTQKEMLQEVAAKLIENEKLFYWGAFKRTYDCGTMHCVIGWLPVWYPDRWRYDEPGIPRYLPSMAYPAWDFCSCFGVTEDEACAIIFPEMQYLIGLPNLTKRASAREVVKIINTVISWYYPCERLKKILNIA